MHDQRVLELATEFRRFKTIPAGLAPKLIQILESGSNEALLLIVAGRVKFCHAIARRILADRGVAVAE